jgi:SpoVK/Ycf46/Vps4 family AAA+-type ATPase
MPWGVDSAFRRPGRFDRVLFVPPPDAEARRQILRTHAAKLPGADQLDLESIVQKTALFTGADLKALAERAAERALEASLASGEVHPVSLDDFSRELAKMNSTASEWLGTARNHAKYANDGGQYDDLREFLKRVRKW